MGLRRRTGSLLTCGLRARPLPSSASRREADSGWNLSTDTETPAGSIPALRSGHREAQAPAHPSPGAGEELEEGAPVEPAGPGRSVQPAPNSGRQRQARLSAPDNEALARLGRPRDRPSAAQFISHGAAGCSPRGGPSAQKYLAGSQPRPRALSPPPAAGPSIILVHRGEALGGDRVRRLLPERPGGPECPTGEAAEEKETKLGIAAKNRPVQGAAPQMPSGPRDPGSSSRHEVAPVFVEMESPVKKHNPKGASHPLGQSAARKKRQEQESRGCLTVHLLTT
uniref:Uncharacterized protein n=1 Tax=Rangifer tarandus platyrhynchus TaxID=3082113 RepID=A0ACB0E5Q3_RANTA|nr:unnamed protein product [Rangifer tarandus platyrhynchus]